MMQDSCYVDHRSIVSFVIHSYKLDILVHHNGDPRENG